MTKRQIGLEDQGESKIMRCQGETNNIQSWSHNIMQLIQQTEPQQERMQVKKSWN